MIVPPGQRMPVRPRAGTSTPRLYHPSGPPPLETIPADPHDPAATIRARIRDRFTELHGQRQQAETRLAALPGWLKARPFASFDLTVLWNKTSGQATVSVEITDATLQALPAILHPDQDGYHDTDTQPASRP